MQVGIVGAGAAGAGAAYAAREHDVTVFEEDPEVGGRTATRRRDDCTYDYGANYVKSEDPRVNRLLTEILDTDGLVDVEEPVWTFDADGVIREGDDEDEHKWTYVEGIAQVVERPLARADATVRCGTRVESLARDGDAWRVYGPDGEDLGAFDALVVTPPAPRTADLLPETDRDADRPTLADALDDVPYRVVYSAVLHYDFAFDRPWYALVNVDREHDVSWLAREELKEGHVPQGESLLVAQMAPYWSERRLDDDPEAVCADAAELVAGLLDDARFADPDWTDHRGWKHALADDAPDQRLLREAEAHGLYFAGDWVAGEGRVHLALRSGLEAGERVDERR